MLDTAKEGKWDELIILGFREGGWPTYAASPNMDVRDLTFLLNYLLATLMGEFEMADKE